MTDTLFPHWVARGIPPWMERAGLRKCKLAIYRLHQHEAAISQAMQDGIEHVVPMLLALNGDPQHCRKKVGREAWKKIHQASLTENSFRLKCMFMLGMSLDDVLLINGREARSSYSCGKTISKRGMLWAFQAGGATVRENTILYRDTERLSGRIPKFEWSRKRMHKEHDAAVVQSIMDKADPTPWAKPWFDDVGGFTFTLLKSAQELQIEGARMRHCVGSYWREAKMGRTTIFSVQGQERATAEFPARRQPQIKSFANGPVSKECAQACSVAYNRYKADTEAA